MNKMLVLIGLAITGSLPAAAAEVDTAAILTRSQISYRADGGFTGVEAFGVVISCVEGEVSVMASIHDPRLMNDEPMRRVGRLSPARYVELWNALVRHAAMKLKDGPKPNFDVADEFSVVFNLSAGDHRRQFRARTLSLPASARYEAIRQLIDEAVDMRALWVSHENEVAALTRPVTFESLQASLITELD